MKIRTQFFPSPHFETIGKFLFTLITSGLALFFLALVVTAQSGRAGLQGRVADSTGAALPGASVTLQNLNTGMEIVLITAADGSFTLAGARDGRYKITASLAGFGAAELADNLPGVEPIELRLEPVALADRITVISGSRQEELRESLNTKVDVIGRNRIRDTGYESVSEVLQELPGVMTRRGTASGDSGSGGEKIQGIDSRQALVSFDGQSVTGARGIKSGIINLDRQVVGNLESIEVVKGASSALYSSDAIGGVINQITREPREPMELNLTASGGSQGRADYRGDVGFGGERFSAFFSGERHKQNPFDLTPTTFDTTGAGFGRTDAYAKARYKFTPGFSLSAWARSYWNQSRGRSRGEEGNQESVTDEDSQSFNLQGDWTINPRLTAQGRGYFSRFDEIGNNMLVPPTRAIPPGNLSERYGKVDGSINAILGDRQLLQAGAEWTTDRYRGFNRLANDAGHKVETASVFVQDKISFGNRVTVTLGSRFDHNSIFGNAFSPKAGVNVRVHDQFRARFSYGRGFRAPDRGQLYFRFLNPTNLYQVIGNPDLRPEHAHSMQLGGEFNSRGRRARLGVNVFYNDVENLIDAVSLGFVASPQQLAALSQQYGIGLSLFQPALNRLLFFYQNISEARTAGVELDCDVKLTRGFLFGGAYTHLNARNLKAGLPLAGRHKHQGNIRQSITVWPGFRGAGDSHTEAVGLPLNWSDAKNIAWKISLPGYGQSSPVVWKGKLFLTAVEGAMKERLFALCYDLQTGRELWRKEFAATFTMKDSGTVSKAAPTPAVDDKCVYFFFESGDLIALDHNGRLQWQRKLAEEYGGYKTNHGLGSSLAMTADAVLTLVVHSGPSFLLAADKRTGKNLWKQELKPGGGWSTPLVIGQAGKQQILLSIGGAVTARDGKTGEPIWTFGGLKGNNIPSPSVDIANSIAVVGSSDKGMNVAIKLGGAGDVTESNILWRAQEATANFSSPLIHEGYVYFVNKVGVAFCLDLKTGEERWRQRLGGEAWASPLAAGNRIYIFGIDGKTLVLRAGAKFEQLAMNELTDVERVYGVAAVDRALLLRSGRKLLKLGER